MTAGYRADCYARVDSRRRGKITVDKVTSEGQRVDGSTLTAKWRSGNHKDLFEAPIFPGLGLGGLVQLGTVPVYHCTKHFVWANSVIPRKIGTYQKNSWYRGHFSSQYGVRSLRGAFAR